MKPSQYAWCAIAVGVVAYNVTARDGDTLSECVDEWIERHRWLPRSAIAMVALHLANALPPQYDVVHRLFATARCLYPMRRRVADAIAPPGHELSQ